MSEDQPTDASPGLLSWERWDRLKQRELFVFAAAVVFVFVWSWLFSRSPVIGDLGGYHSIAKSILIWGIFAMGFNILLGETGLLSFGHAMFWGTGGYAAAILSIYLISDPILMLLVALFAGLILDVLTGVVALRLHEVYFAIITLAFAQLVYYLAESPLRPLTRGRNGLTRIDVDPLFGTFRLREEFHGGGLLETFLVDYQYLLIGIVFVLAVVFINRLRKSPYGLIFRAIRENEGRVPDVGLNVWRYKFAAYVISGGVVGLGGGLLTIESAFAGLRSMYWVTSGEIVIMTVLGGIGTLFGPVLGVVIFLYFKNVVNGLPTIGPYWLIILATVFTAIIWIYPDGIWGAIKQGAAKVRSLVED
jgi:branched-chain amino acid transport system permease protein